MRVIAASKGWRFALALVLGLAVVLPAPAGASDTDDYTEAYQRLVAQRSSSVVPVKYVITVAAGGQEQRNEDRTQGVLVGADGLVLVSARAVSFDLGAINQRSSAAAGSVVANSSDFRVRLPGSDEWRTAVLSASYAAPDVLPDIPLADAGDHHVFPAGVGR